MADNGKLLIAESDYVKVKDADGNVQPDAVPKAWVGTHLLPEGWKAATAKEAKVSDEEPGSGDNA